MEVKLKFKINSGEQIENITVPDDWYTTEKDKQDLYLEKQIRRFGGGTLVSWEGDEQKSEPEKTEESTEGSTEQNTEENTEKGTMGDTKESNTTSVPDDEKPSEDASSDNN